MNKEKTTIQETINILEESYKKFECEPDYFEIRENTSYFIDGYPFSFYKKYKGLSFNTTMSRGGFSANSHRRHLTIIGDDISLNGIIFDSDLKSIKPLSTKEKYEWFKLSEEEFSEALEVIPKLFVEAGYYDVEVKNESESIVCLILNKKKR